MILRTNRRESLKAKIRDGLFVLMSAAVGGSLIAVAASWMHFPPLFIAGGTLFSGLVGLGLLSGNLRAWVALGCLGTILQPSLFPATMCDGQLFLWPFAGAVIGASIGKLFDQFKY